MQLNFRQGLVRAPANFLALSGSNVNLNIASPETVVAAFADGDANYLITERQTVVGAWVGPFTSDTWLYWDIDKRTGQRTFGFTLLEPIEGATPPLSPANDQHWFDTTTNKMKVWNSIASRWVERIRVFAASLQGGSVITSMSINAPVFTGTQVGSLANTPVSAGALVFDTNANPFKRSNGTFYTTEDKVTTGIGSSTQVKLNSIVVEAMALESIPAFTIVRFADFGKIGIASDVAEEGVYGIIETDGPAGDLVAVTTEGVVTNTDWDWSAAGINAPLYVAGDGTLTPTESPNGVAVALVIDRHSVLIRPTVVALSGDSSPAAANVTIVDAGGNFTATNVEDALAELAAGGIGVPVAADITIADAGGNFTATNVEDALAELAADVGGIGIPVAADITIADTGNNFTATNVEAALAELAADIGGIGVPVAADITIADVGGNFTATDVEGALAELATAPAPSAGSITIVDTGNNFTATDVEGALAELATDIGGIGTPVASDITIADSGLYYTATNVEDALQEIAADVSGLSAPTAANVSIVDSGLYFTATNVENALAELAVEVDGSAKLAVPNVFTSVNRPSYTTVSISTTSSYFYNPLTDGQVVDIALTNATTITFGAPANIVPGSSYQFILRAVDGGVRTFAWGASFKFPSGTPPISAGTINIGAVDILTFIGAPGNVLYYNGHVADVR